MITDEYRFLMGIVGGYVDLDVSAVEEFVLDSEEVSLTLSARFCPESCDSFRNKMRGEVKVLYFRYLNVVSMVFMKTLKLG